MHASGGVLSFFGERKYPKNAARNRVVSGHPPRATHILDCWCVCHTVVGFCKGSKDRIVSALAPQPLTVRNVGVCGSFFGPSAAAAQKESRFYVSATSCRTPAWRPERKLRNHRFLAHLWALSVRTESAPPEEEHADSITNPLEKTHSLRKRVGSECYLQIIAAEIRVGLAAHGDIALTAAQHDDRRAGQAVVI